MRQEAAICFAIGIPVHIVEVFLVELIFNLLPHMVEHIGALIVGTVVELRLEVDGRWTSLSDVDLLDARTGADEEVLEIFVGLHVAASNVFHHDFRLVLAHIVLPEVHAFLEGSLIVERIAAWRENGVAQTGRVHGEAHNAVAAILEVELQRFYGRFAVFLLGGILTFSFILGRLVRLLCVRLAVVLLVLSGLFGCLFGHHLFFFAHTEMLIGIEVEKHHVDVCLSPPAAVTAVAGAVALENHGLAAQHPFGAALVVAALREVVDFL